MCHFRIQNVWQLEAFDSCILNKVWYYAWIVRKILWSGHKTKRIRVVEFGFKLHLEKKFRCPLEELFPSNESLCFRLSEGPPWTLLGAEMSMLLLLSLLLELRPRPETCISPEPSWEGREKEQLVMKAPVTTVAALWRRIMWGELMMCVPRWTVKCGMEKNVSVRVNLFAVSRSDWQKWVEECWVLKHLTGGKGTSCFSMTNNGYYATCLPRGILSPFSTTSLKLYENNKRGFKAPLQLLVYISCIVKLFPVVLSLWFFFFLTVRFRLSWSITIKLRNTQKSSFNRNRLYLCPPPW